VEIKLIGSCADKSVWKLAFARMRLKSTPALSLPPKAACARCESRSTCCLTMPLCGAVCLFVDQDAQRTRRYLQHREQKTNCCGVYVCQDNNGTKLVATTANDHRTERKRANSMRNTL